MTKLTLDEIKEKIKEINNKWESFPLEQIIKLYEDNWPDKEESKPTMLQEKKASEGWIVWNGGDCPVGEKATVYFRLRNGLVFPPSPAGILFWRNTYGEHDIIAYRVIEQKIEESKEIKVSNEGITLSLHPDFELMRKQFNERNKTKKAHYDRIKSKLRYIQWDLLDKKGIGNDTTDLVFWITMIQEKLDYLIEELFGEDK